MTRREAFRSILAHKAPDRVLLDLAGCPLSGLSGEAAHSLYEYMGYTDSDSENLERLYNELLTKDWFMTLLDFKSYVAKKEEAFKDYENRMEWAKKMLINTAKAGFFSSDRTIEEYNNDIWHL